MQNLIQKIIDLSHKINDTKIDHKIFDKFIKNFYQQNKLIDFENYHI